MIGYLGDMEFTASDRKLFTIKDLKISNRASYARHAIAGGKEEIELVGKGAKSVSFSMTFHASLSQDPAEGLALLRAALDDAQPLGLVIGDAYLGDYVLESIDETWETIGPKGEVISAVAAVSLLEFTEDL